MNNNTFLVKAKQGKNLPDRYYQQSKHIKDGDQYYEPLNNYVRELILNARMKQSFLDNPDRKQSIWIVADNPDIKHPDPEKRKAAKLNPVVLEIEYNPNPKLDANKPQDQRGKFTRGYFGELNDLEFDDPTRQPERINALRDFYDNKDITPDNCYATKALKSVKVDNQYNEELSRVAQEMYHVSREDISEDCRDKVYFRQFTGQSGDPDAYKEKPYYSSDLACGARVAKPVAISKREGNKSLLDPGQLAGMMAGIREYISEYNDECDDESEYLSQGYFTFVNNETQETLVIAYMPGSEQVEVEVDENASDNNKVVKKEIQEVSAKYLKVLHYDKGNNDKSSLNNRLIKSMEDKQAGMVTHLDQSNRFASDINRIGYKKFYQKKTYDKSQKKYYEWQDNGKWYKQLQEIRNKQTMQAMQDFQQRLDVLDKFINKQQDIHDPFNQQQSAMAKRQLANDDELDKKPLADDNQSLNNDEIEIVPNSNLEEDIDDNRVDKALSNDHEKKSTQVNDDKDKQIVDDQQKKLDDNRKMDYQVVDYNQLANQTPVLLVNINDIQNHDVINLNAIDEEDIEMLYEHVAGSANYRDSATNCLLWLYDPDDDNDPVLIQFQQAGDNSGKLTYRVLSDDAAAANLSALVAAKSRSFPENSMDVDNYVVSVKESLLTPIRDDAGLKIIHGSHQLSNISTLKVPFQLADTQVADDFYDYAIDDKGMVTFGQDNTNQQYDYGEPQLVVVNPDDDNELDKDYSEGHNKTNDIVDDLYDDADDINESYVDNTTDYINPTAGFDENVDQENDYYFNIDGVDLNKINRSFLQQAGPRTIDIICLPQGYEVGYNVRQIAKLGQSRYAEVFGNKSKMPNHTIYAIDKNGDILALHTDASGKKFQLQGPENFNAPNNRLKKQLQATVNRPEFSDDNENLLTDYDSDSPVGNVIKNLTLEVNKPTGQFAPSSDPKAWLKKLPEEHTVPMITTRTLSDMQKTGYLGYSVDVVHIGNDSWKTTLQKIEATAAARYKKMGFNNEYNKQPKGTMKNHAVAVVDDWGNLMMVYYNKNGEYQIVPADQLPQNSDFNKALRDSFSDQQKVLTDYPMASKQATLLKQLSDAVNGNRQNNQSPYLGAKTPLFFLGKMPKTMTEYQQKIEQLDPDIDSIVSMIAVNPKDDAIYLTINGGEPSTMDWLILDRLAEKYDKPIGFVWFDKDQNAVIQYRKGDKQNSGQYRYVMRKEEEINDHGMKRVKDKHVKEEEIAAMLSNNQATSLAQLSSPVTQIPSKDFEKMLSANNSSRIKRYRPDKHKLKKKNIAIMETEAQIKDDIEQAQAQQAELLVEHGAIYTTPANVAKTISPSLAALKLEFNADAKDGIEGCTNFDYTTIANPSVTKDDKGDDRLLTASTTFEYEGKKITLLRYDYPAKDGSGHHLKIFIKPPDMWNELQNKAPNALGKAMFNMAQDAPFLNIQTPMPNKLTEVMEDLAEEQAVALTRHANSATPISPMGIYTQSNPHPMELPSQQPTMINSGEFDFDNKIPPTYHKSQQQLKTHPSAGADHSDKSNYSDDMDQEGMLDDNAVHSDQYSASQMMTKK